MIKPGNYETVDGLSATVEGWDDEFKAWHGFVENYPVQGMRHNTNWLDDGTEVGGKDELDLDID